jgi:hypothetical protein
MSSVSAGLVVSLLVANASTLPQDGAFSCPSLPPAGVDKSDPRFANRPSIDGSFTFIGGQQVPFQGDLTVVHSPVYDIETGERLKIGTLPNMGDKDAIAAVNAAADAWDQGQGEWPQMPLAARISAIERFVVELKVLSILPVAHDPCSPSAFPSAHLITHVPFGTSTMTTPSP